MRVIKCGKLNLVDLSCSREHHLHDLGQERVEQGKLARSTKVCLPLGRVINALVEHSGHVPYSKLTRLLRDSLGGKTKTCIIATISPSIHCLEETLSTLDYAHRAKNIKNKPEINQKMMKSALIKDLYSEIDRLKQEVYAAREKNGIYIPRDRYLLEEAREEVRSCVQQLMEVQDLTVLKLNLTAELGNKLERAERNLEETEHSLIDLEEKHRQSKSNHQRKEYLICNLLKSEKALVDRALDLRADLENATSDVSNLLAKIERKDRIEDENRILVQNFQVQLREQLELLHKNVADSMTRQEQQLKDMEGDMQSFVKTKAGVTEQLSMQLGKLKDIYNSGVKALDDISVELDKNTRSTFSYLNSEVSGHSSRLEEFFGTIASEAEKLLSDFHSCLLKQEDMLKAYARQQREAHLRAVVIEAQTKNDQQLSELERKFEEFAANEERQMLEKIAELLASSNARKKSWYCSMAVHDLRESASSKATKLQEEMSTMVNSTSNVKAEWNLHVEKTESQYIEDTSAVEAGRQDLEEVLQGCFEKTKMGVDQWKSAKESLVGLEKRNVASISSIVRNAMEINETLRTRFSSTLSGALDNVDISNRNLLSSTDHSLQLDHNACENLKSTVGPCYGHMTELQGGHHNKVVDITRNAAKCLLEEYEVDEPTCSTPRRRPFNLPSVSSIEELRTPAFEELLKSFWEMRSSRQANGDVKHVFTSNDVATQSMRDSRLPLTAIN
ncbi:hypothetical protein MLD38_017320 [Melastoma candidum]|uniref:Uncharacterized protein n=1 Tax=Melastoma candidum TaxID=119954 RepID=A0ACB9QPF7_9MYRT|nr:hypothetical protein MLD38_017320 [Melastoma candidum]